MNVPPPRSLATTLPYARVITMSPSSHYLPDAAYLRVRLSVRVLGVLMPARNLPTCWVSPAGRVLLAAPPGELAPRRIGEVPSAPTVGLSSMSLIIPRASDFEPRKLILKSFRANGTCFYYTLKLIGKLRRHLRGRWMFHRIWTWVSYKRA